MKTGKTRKTAAFAAFAPAMLFCCAAQAEEAPPTTQVSIGVKLWNAAWQSYLPGRYAGVDASGRPALGETLDSVDGERRTSALPLLAVRHGNVFASASYGRFTSDFSAPTSPLPIASGATLVTGRTDHFTRRESDLALGYFVTPEMALTVGYKDATEDRTTRLSVAPQATPLLHNTAKAVLAGVVGSFQVQGALRLYVQGGYGPARIKTRFADASLAPIDANGRYLIGEIGFSYPLFAGNDVVRAATAQVGYRTQTAKTYSTGTISHQSRDVRDVRDGLVLSLNVTL